MSPEEHDFDFTADEKSDFVPVVYARSLDEAEEYRSLLEDHDIPAQVGTEGDVEDDDDIRVTAKGIPVLVPEVLLDEASEVIADREDLEEFAVADDELDEEQEDGDDLDYVEPLSEDEEPFGEEDLLDDEDDIDDI